MSLKSFANVARILVPRLAFAAGGRGGTGASNAGNGSPGGANGDASKGNTPVDALARTLIKALERRAFIEIHILRL